MAEGTVVYVNPDAGWGKIEPDGGGEQIFFRLNWVKNPPAGGDPEGDPPGV